MKRITGVVTNILIKFWAKRHVGQVSVFLEGLDQFFSGLRGHGVTWWLQLFWLIVSNVTEVWYSPNAYFSQETYPSFNALRAFVSCHSLPSDQHPLKWYVMFSTKWMFWFPQPLLPPRYEIDSLSIISILWSVKEWLSSKERTRKAFKVYIS